MSSLNEDPPQPKKQSPLEFRNTDLVSRLLAATPPYLYNMPLVPHSYFFSEMLRSLVQGKTEAAARLPPNAPHRRSRKRAWSGRSDHFIPNKQMSPKCDQTDMPPPNWTPKLPEKHEFMEKVERPLELTNKGLIGQKNHIDLLDPRDETTKINHLFSSSEQKHLLTSPEKNHMLLHGDKSDQMPQGPMLFPNLPQSQETGSDLILPPPPPIWYPPLYPAPYGIDPLHFFIDLRVSGHIYDRKKDGLQIPHMPNSQLNHLPINTEVLNAASSTVTSSSSESTNLVRQSRHSSAFSVPVPSLNRNDPLNLSGGPKFNFRAKDEKSKFDIKSMGFDTSNSISTNYILKNLSQIYKNVHETKYEAEGIDLTSPKQEEDVNVKDEDGNEEEKDVEKDKQRKDLRALIGLELVVDYVKHEVKPVKGNSSDNTDGSDVSSEAVVTIHDEESRA